MKNLSSRASKAIDVLKNGGRFVDRLETNSYTRHQMWMVRLLDSDRNVVSGFGRSTLNELRDRLFVDNQFSVAIYYAIKDGKNERIAELRRLSRGPAEGFEYAGWEADASRAKAELAMMEAT